MPPTDRQTLIETKIEILSLYNIMGEGFVVELRENNETYLYDRQGLQHRILDRKKNGIDTHEEERALAQINSFGPHYGLTEIAPT